eukprot:g12944.t1
MSSSLISDEDITAWYRDGAVKLTSVFNEEQLKQIREAYDWSIANPSNIGMTLFGSDNYYNDAASLTGKNADKIKAKILPYVVDSPLPEIAQRLFHGNSVYYYDHEIFTKRYGNKTKPRRKSTTPFQKGGKKPKRKHEEGGKEGRSDSPFHQDTGYIGIMGQFVGFWISFEDIPQQNCLEIVKGSHRGPMYDGTPFVGGRVNVHKYKAQGKLDVLSWNLKKGDVVCFNPHSLHGNAGTDNDFQERNTIVFRFFSDKAYYKKLPPKRRARWTRHLNSGDYYYKTNHFTKVAESTQKSRL